MHGDRRVAAVRRGWLPMGLATAVLTVLVALVLAPAALAQSDQATCQPFFVSVAAKSAYGSSPQGGREVTEYFSGGAYRVTRCSEDGSPQLSVAAAPFPGATGSEYRATAITRPIGRGLIKTTHLQYEDAAQLRTRTGSSRGAQAVLPPTDPGRVSEPGSPAASGTGTMSGPGNSCSHGSYRWLGTYWPTRHMTYLTRNSSYPAGNTTREEITKGHHAWNYTENDCGYGDQDNITGEWGGVTSEGVHSTYDALNVVDFGRVENVCSDCDSDTLAVAKRWAYADGTMASADTRFDTGSDRPWVHNGQASGYDVRAVAAHEAGHTLIALGDLYGGNDEWLTMYGRTGMGSIRQHTLARGDILGMRAIYP